MDLSQLKTQVVTMFMMKSAQQPPLKAQQQFEVWSILYSMILINFVEYMFRHIPAIAQIVQAWLNTKWKPTKKEWIPDFGKTNTEQNSITMTRIFQKQTSDRETNVNVEKVDAVLDFICALDSARHVRLDTRYTIGSTEDIQLTNDLKGRVKTSGTADTASNETLTFEIVLFSSILKLTEIRAWVEEVHKNYVMEKNNKLGNNIYYFNEVPNEPTVITDMTGDVPKKTYRWDNMPKTLTFNMNEFKTSKSFSNVYGAHVDELKERLDLFVNNLEWYADRGIPHSLGIMLHGIPGAGKTSTIKAIAKDTHRHIFNLSLRSYTTQKQLMNLFYNESIVVNKYDGTKTTYNIPINRRLYVIEDIDCMSDVTFDRSAVTAAQEGDAITLGFLLNLFDGVLETPGRILVVTSNYPEKMDKALVRPGRIDVKIEFKNASREFIREMVSRFYSKDITMDRIPFELDGVFSPAEVMESLCTYFKDADGAIRHMMNKRPKQQKQPNITVHDFHDVVIDSGTSLESLGVSTEPKNEIIIDKGRGQIVVNTAEKPEEEAAKPAAIDFTNPIIPIIDIISAEMASNGQNTVPIDNLLNSGLIVNSIQDEPGFQSSINPEFIQDESGIDGYDALGNNPTTWSAPDADIESINTESAECIAYLLEKEKELRLFLSTNNKYGNIEQTKL